MNLTVDLQNASSASGIPAAATFRRWVAAALAGREDAEVSIRIVDEAESAELNQRYRHQNKPTTVLSLPAALPPGVDSPLLGDLAICAPVVAREAAEQHKPPEAHWAHMVVHGTLHLLGHDHIEPDKAEAMETLETEILSGLGIADPYVVTDICTDGSEHVCEAQP